MSDSTSHTTVPAGSGSRLPLWAPGLGAPPVGAIVGGEYVIRGWLGSGAMGTVLSATHRSSGKDAAIKVLATEAARNPASTEALMREAAWASCVRHSNVVRILDWGVDRVRKLPFIAMERVAGRTLREHINREGRLTASRALEVCTQLARALDACHTRRLVHLDLKPDNVMVVGREDGSLQVKLIDFGLVYSMDEVVDPACTRAGTLAYMSPEQVVGGYVDERADLFAFGCVLHELLTGEVPFSTRERLTKWFDGTTFEVPSLRTSGRVALDAVLADLHAALLQPSPTNRPRSAAQAAAVLASIPRIDAHYYSATASVSRRAFGHRGYPSSLPTLRRSRHIGGEQRPPRFDTRPEYGAGDTSVRCGVRGLWRRP